MLNPQWCLPVQTHGTLCRGAGVAGVASIFRCTVPSCFGKKSGVHKQSLHLVLTMWDPHPVCFIRSGSTLSSGDYMCKPQPRVYCLRVEMFTHGSTEAFVLQLFLLSEKKKTSENDTCSVTCYRHSCW